MKAPRSVGHRLIAVSAVYLMAALVLGFVMGITGDHSLFSVHSHLGLLGWATMGLTGLVYLVLPACESSVLARMHFWLHNAGLPVMMIALALVTRTSVPAQPALGLGSLLVVLALLAFTVNVIRNGRAAPVERVAQAAGR